MEKVRWGTLSTARIARLKVLPGMQRGKYCDVTAIASRDLAKAREAAAELGIPKAYGSYEELLADPDVDAIYNPLPNHMHVPWSIRALEAGKHVLCEKPIGLSVDEAEQLLEASRRHPDLKVMEAFMYRFHPQWQEAYRLVNEGRIGTLTTIHTIFSYFKLDSTNIRNKPDMGGGGLMDIGCYAISLSRWLFGAEPERVFATLDYDPVMGIDRLGSGILDFGRGTATFTYGTQIAPFQRVQIFGTEGRIEIEIPFNAPPDQPCRMTFQHDDETEEILFDTADQYEIQGDLFSLAVLNDTPVPTPLEDAVANMRVIEAVVRSARIGTWA